MQMDLLLHWHQALLLADKQMLARDWLKKQQCLFKIGEEAWQAEQA